MAMTEEEKKAIEYLTKDLKKADMLEMTVHTDNKSLRIALNLIKKQQTELEALNNSTSNYALYDLAREMRRDGSQYWANRLSETISI